MSGNVSKTYIPPNRKLISKEVLDVIYEQNMKRNLIYKELLDVIHEHNLKIILEMIKKEAEIFGLLFLGDGATISRCPLLNILASAKNLPADVLEIIYFQGHLADGNKK